MHPSTLSHWQMINNPDVNWNSGTVTVDHAFRLAAAEGAIPFTIEQLDSWYNQYSGGYNAWSATLRAYMEKAGQAPPPPPAQQIASVAPTAADIAAAEAAHRDYLRSLGGFYGEQPAGTMVLKTSDNLVVPHVAPVVVPPSIPPRSELSMESFFGGSATYWQDWLAQRGRGDYSTEEVAQLLRMGRSPEELLATSKMVWADYGLSQASNLTPEESQMFAALMAETGLSAGELAQLLEEIAQLPEDQQYLLIATAEGYD